MHDLTHIDLFSGIGGFALAAGWAGFRTIAFCEIESFCQEVLKQRFGAVEDPERIGRPHGGDGEEGAAVRGLGESGAGNGDGVYQPTLYSDIRTFDGSRFRGATLLTGGFPCQPFSVAGKRRGKGDDRHLWPEMRRVIRECQPHWVVAENVSGIIRMELDQVLSDLEMEGYTCRTFHIGAVGVNAPHRRMRVWIVAHRDDWGQSGDLRASVSGGQGKTEPNSQLGGRDSGGRGLYRQGKGNGSDGDSWDIPWIEVATSLCRLDDGLPAWVHARRVARLRALGNAIVPQVAYEIIQAIAAIEGDHP